MAQTKIKLIADGVIDVNNLAAGHTITTDNIGEGSNLYYTDARVSNYLTTNSYATESFVSNYLTTNNYATESFVSNYLTTNNYATEGYVDTGLLGKLSLTGGTLTGDVFTSGTITANAFVGDGSGITGVSTDYTVQEVSTNTTAVSGVLYVLTASVTLTLPASPSIGDKVAVSNMSDTITPIIARNGSLLIGLAEDFTFDVKNATIEFIYSGGTDGWIMLADAIYGSGITGGGGSSGTGTANFVTKWTDTSTIGDSVIYESGGRIAIGTTSVLPDILDIRVPYTKTDTTRRDILYASNEITDPAGLRISITGGASQGARSSHLQTTEWGISNDGNLCLQPFGGNVGIGTGSPLGKLDVRTSGSAANIFVASDVSTSGLASRIALGNSTSIARLSMGLLGSSGEIAYFGSEGNFPIYFQTHGAERMRIDSAGNIGIGTSIPYTKLSVYRSLTAAYPTYSNPASGGFDGLFFASTINSSDAYQTMVDIGGVTANTDASSGGSAIRFLTQPKISPYAPIERMRITRGGSLKATTTGSYINVGASYHELRTGENARTLLVTNSSPSLSVENGIDIIFTAAAPNNAASKFFVCEDTSAFRFIVYSNGNVVNTNNSYGAISDAKTKENIADASPKLDDLMQVKVRNFNYIGDSKKQLGVVAQELEEVFPSMIDESPDYDEVEITDEEGNVVTERIETGTTTKSVKYSVFVPMLIKAMQEQQDIIKELKARIEILENK